MIFNVFNHLVKIYYTFENLRRVVWFDFTQNVDIPDMPMQVINVHTDAHRFYNIGMVPPNKIIFEKKT